MKKIVHIVFILILVLFGYSLLNKEQVEVQAADDINTESTSATETLEDGTTVTVETHTDGTVVTTETYVDGTQHIIASVPESYGIHETVCPYIYTVEDNEWYVEVNSRETTDKPEEENKAPSYQINQDSGCWNSKDQIMQIANGTYEDMQLYTNDGAFFYIIDENDVVEITVNGTTYVLDANNPTLELKLEFGDEVTINSSNPLGVYYDTECGNMYSGEYYYEYTE